MRAQFSRREQALAERARGLYSRTSAASILPKGLELASSGAAGLPSHYLHTTLLVID